MKLKDHTETKKLCWVKLGHIVFGSHMKRRYLFDARELFYALKASNVETLTNVSCFYFSVRMMRQDDGYVEEQYH